MTFNKAQRQSLKQVGLYISTPVFSHGQYYVGLSRAGSFASVKVVVVDGDRQGLFEGHDDVPDGVYTDNVVWKEALLGHDVDAPHSCAAAPVKDTHPTVLLAPSATLQTSGTHELTENLDVYFNESSGAPLTPRSGELQQPLDRHGTDDTDEYGAAPPQASATNVMMAVPASAPELVVKETQVEVLPTQGTQEMLEPDPDDIAALMSDLELRARACGVGRSEWYEVSKRPLLDVLRFMEALETPDSRGASSST